MLLLIVECDTRTHVSGRAQLNNIRRGYQETAGQKQKNRPWAVTTLLHIALILFVLIDSANMVPGVGLEPTQP